MSQIGEEADRQLRRLAKMFLPVPDKDTIAECHGALCEAGTVGRVSEAGERLMKGFPLDSFGNRRQRFPNTADIDTVLSEIVQSQTARLQEWTGPALRSVLEEEWFTSDLAQRPEMIRKWQEMANLSGEDLMTKSRREVARKILRDLERFTGTAVMS